MVKKTKEKPLKPLITAMAEWAVDDAIKAAEKWPGRKRTTFDAKTVKRILKKETPERKRPKRKGEK